MIRPFELEIRLLSRGLRSGPERAGGPDGLRSRRRPTGSDTHADSKEVSALPSSALRGALRTALEALLRGAGEPACAGGDGQLPGAATASSGPCALADGAPCRACRLFGGADARLAPEQRRFSALVLGAAQAQLGELRWQPGVGVSVERARRAVGAGGRHAAGALELGGALRASGRLLDASLAPLLEAAVRATTSLGGGASRGYGRVELELRWLEAHSPEPLPLPPGSELRVRVELRSPAGFGTPASGAQWRDTRREIPGSALRGALGFALREQLESPAEGELAPLLDERAGARFGFLYPLRGGSRPAPALGPWPLTAQVCASAGLDHGVLDTLLQRIRAACAATPEEAERAWSARSAACPICGAPLATPNGSRGCVPPPATRLLGRLALDRERAAAAAQSWLEECLDPADDVAFEGTISGLGDAARPLLARALAGPLALGRGVALGRGQVRVELLPARPLPPLAERAAAFERALAQSLSALGFDAAAAEQLVPLTLCSPLVPEQAGSDGSAELAAAFGAGAPEWLLCARRFAAEGGFEQREGRATAALAVAGGSVFVARWPGGWRAHQRELEQLERDGAGLRRHQGYGQLLCFDPLIAESAIGEARP